MTKLYNPGRQKKIIEGGNGISYFLKACYYNICNERKRMWETKREN